MGGHDQRILALDSRIYGRRLGRDYVRSSSVTRDVLNRSFFFDDRMLFLEHLRESIYGSRLFVLFYSCRWKITLINDSCIRLWHKENLY